MTRTRPTPEQLDAAAAITRFHARTTARAEAALAFIVRTLLAVAIGAAGAWALLEWATPCAEAHWCLSLAAVRVDLLLRRWHRHLQIALLETRAVQLALLVQFLAPSLQGRHPSQALHYASTLCLEAAVRFKLKALLAEQAEQRS